MPAAVRDRDTGIPPDNEMNRFSPLCMPPLSRHSQARSAAEVIPERRSA
jgi:hypothetical protein